jgi:hypothetical protein
MGFRARIINGFGLVVRVRRAGSAGNERVVLPPVLPWHVARTASLAALSSRRTEARTD